MYINPFACGVIATILTELVLTITFIVIEVNKFNKEDK